tara:strand:+ start:5950 stop:6633 length:684 start_codon:yes stop_codon:yes gene_type:complete
MHLQTKDVSLYTKVTSRLKNGRHYRGFEQERAGLQLQQFTAQKSAIEHSLANQKEILWRALALGVPTVLLTPRTIQFMGNNDVVADEIMTNAQLKAFDTSENHYSRSTWRSEVSDEGNECLELNLNYENYAVLPSEQGFFHYVDGKYERIKNRHKQIEMLWDYGFPSKRGRPIMVGRVGHSGSKIEIIGLVDWLEKLRMLNNGSEIQYKTQQIYNTLNRSYAWPEHW